jgi:hypothetical protein
MWNLEAARAARNRATAVCRGKSCSTMSLRSGFLGHALDHEFGPGSPAATVATRLRCSARKRLLDAGAPMSRQPSGID